MRRLLPLIVICSFAACGSDDPKALTAAGTKALNSGDAKGAISSFDRALAQMDAGDPDFRRASIGRCLALARIEPERVPADFLELAQSQPSRVGEPEYIAVASELAERGSIGPATAIAEAGLKRYPDSVAMTVLRDTIGDAAKKAGDPESLKKLKGLGYAGDG